MGEANAARQLVLLAVTVLAAGGLVVRAADCNGNGTEDAQDIASGTSQDCNGNGVPDECDLTPQPIKLAPPISFATGTGPGSVAAGDFDGDGDVDAIVANGGASYFSLFSNPGDGNFAPAVSLPATAGVGAVIAADLDLDGDLDLVTIDPAGFASRLNNGDATFGAPVGSGYALPKGSAVADWSGDGYPDLTFTQFASNIMGRVGHGDGTFSADVYLGDSGWPGGAGLVAADLDGDGDLDLAAAGSYSYTVGVLKNNGSGSFGPTATYDVSGMAAVLTAADLDGDADRDLATANFNSNNVTTLRNGGSGSFASGVTLSGVTQPSSIAAADLDGDGDLDLVVTQGNSVTVFPGKGNGTFSGPLSFAAGLSPRALALHDFDGDGHLDAVVANPPADEISVLLNRPGPLSQDCNANVIPDECEPDADFDGVPDGCDLCPGADDKVNTDGDSAPNCLDPCPFDAHKTAPGKCGCGLPDLTSCALAASPWPTLRHDDLRTARSPIVTSQTGVPVYPSRSAGGFDVDYTSPAVVAPYGTVYFSNGTSLLAVNPSDGTYEWTSALIDSPPILGPDGTIYGTRDDAAGPSAPAPGFVVALHPSGAVKWTVQVDDTLVVFHGLAVDAAGTVYGSYSSVEQPAPIAYGRWRFAIDANGNVLWKHGGPAGLGVFAGSSIIRPDGTIFQVAWTDAPGQTQLVRVDPATGNVVWAVDAGAGGFSDPVLADDGLVLLHSGGTLPNGVHAYHPDSGQQVWFVPYQDQTWGAADNPPALLSNGQIVAVWSGKVYRISPSGHVLAIIPFPGTGAPGNPIVGGDDTVYVWSDKKLLAFSPFDGTVKFQFVPAPSGQCFFAPSPTILRDGALFTTWYRRTYCEDYTGSRHYTVLASPVIAAGAVPDGDAVPGTPLSIGKAAGGDLELSWGDACASGAVDYAIYEGDLGVFTSHLPGTCSTGGATTATRTPGAGSRYFLVVPQSANREGSYGLDGDGVERPPSGSACREQAVGGCP